MTTAIYTTAPRTGKLIRDDGSTLNVADAIANLSAGGAVGVGIADNPAWDAFARFRVSTPTTLFSNAAQYSSNPLLWAQKIVGDGTITHQPTESAVDLTVGTSAGDRVVRQSREYHRYQPGKIQYIKLTGTLGAPAEGVTRLIGYGDDANGVFFGCDGGGVFLLLRSSVGGSVDDTRKVYQADWNGDKLDGTGPSGKTYDPTTANIHTVDIEWLGVGTARAMVIMDRTPIVVHDFHNDNRLPSTYMSTANLPCRYEIFNATAQAAPHTLKQICSEVESEGGFERELAYPFSAWVDRAVNLPIGEDNAVVIFAARHKLTYEGQTNRAQFTPLSYQVVPNGGRVVSRIVYNPTIIGGAWGDIDPISIMEGNATATGFINGIRINTDISVGGGNNRASGSAGTSITSRLPYGLDVDGQNPVSLALIAFALDSNTRATFSFSWEELH
jgi:hypothetical protein